MQTIRNGDAAVWTIPTTFTDLGGTVAAGQLPAGVLPIASINASGTPSSSTFLRGDGSWATPSGSGGGTVNSVAMTGDGVVFNSTVSGSPITNTGTLAPALLAQAVNTVFAGPSTGPSAAPAFRALVVADIPTLNQNTTGSAGSVAAANVSVGTMASGMTFVAPVLGTPASGTLTNCTFPTLNQNTTGTAANLSGTPTLPSGTTLVAPVLGTPASGNLVNCTFPTLNQNTSGTAANLSGTPTLPSGTTLVAPVLGTPASGTLTNCTFPTLNQNTSGTSAGLTGTPAITVGTIAATTITSKRVNAHAGTVPTTSSFTPSAGWGTSPTQTVVQGTDMGLNYTITAKATVSASPTITYVFKDGTFTQVPIVVCHRTDVVAAAAAPSATVTNQWTAAATATQVVFTFNGTPVANNTYGLAFIVMGT